MKRKLLSASWFIAAILLVTAEPQSNMAMILYVPLMANFILSAICARKTFKTSPDGH